MTVASSPPAGSRRRPPPAGPRIFVSASAIGFYGSDRGDEGLDEDSSRGPGFLADVVADWEAATGPAAAAGVRVVAVRTGIVQAAAGGTLRVFRPLFGAGLGGRLGTGRQWLSGSGLTTCSTCLPRAVGRADERAGQRCRAGAGAQHRQPHLADALAHQLGHGTPAT